MTATRSRREHKTYARYLQDRGSNTECQFCAINKSSDQFVLETTHFKVIRNIFAYSVWDSHEVSDHLMVVPKTHTDTLKTLNAAAAKEYLDLISDHEQEGYNIYARAPGSNMKSVVHQHTHLIKLGKKRKNMVFILRKPYIRITR